MDAEEEEDIDSYYIHKIDKNGRIMCPGTAFSLFQICFFLVVAVLFLSFPLLTDSHLVDTLLCFLGSHVW